MRQALPFLGELDLRALREFTTVYRGLSRLLRQRYLLVGQRTLPADTWACVALGRGIRATGDAIDIDKWINDNIYGKFTSYLKMRASLPHYENASIGWKFSRAIPEGPFRRAVVEAVSNLRASTRDVHILLDISLN